ncbi:MAG: 4Fe-4S binding protein [Nanoarchaeota archaeon]|nr:4Fe-4S binding protein [Nanoarchaeota archaeon]
METVKILKFNKDLCIGCLSCETACSNVHFKDDIGREHSAIRINKEEDGFTMDVCNHCGLCMDLCQTLALKRIAQGQVLLDKKRCVGCQACVAFCPTGTMRKTDGEIIPFKCISCGACVQACPEKALELVEVPISQVKRVVFPGGDC